MSKTANNPERCDACRFWKRMDVGSFYPYERDVLTSDDLASVGECQRFPPITDPVNLGEISRERRRKTGLVFDDAVHMNRLDATKFSVTWDDQWCGEFQARPAKD